MTTSNYRVVRRVVNAHPLYTIIEVFYYDDGAVHAIERHGHPPWGRSREGCAETLAKMQQALNRPVLDEDETYKERE